jgi:uncharacterized protein YwgA
VGELLDIQSAAAALIRDCGGSIVGRTRLQKVAYLLELAGFGNGFDFSYKYYGPYSEELTLGIRMARAFGVVTEVERTTNWGGFYSIYEFVGNVRVRKNKDRIAFASEASKIDPVELELAATAAYLAVAEHCRDPWGETARRKPEKSANGRIEQAKNAYRRLQQMKSAKPLPAIV